MQSSVKTFFEPVVRVRPGARENAAENPDEARIHVMAGSHVFGIATPIAGAENCPPHQLRTFGGGLNIQTVSTMGFLISKETWL